jgi:tetratricopeptide (TPR) repeat protein
MIMNTVIDLGPPQPEALSLQSQPEPVPVATPAPDVEQIIRTLQSQLSAETADAVGREATRLREQGIRHPELDHLHGLVHVLKGESAAAAENFRMAIAQAPGHYRSLVNLAGLLVGQGRLEEAQALLQKALEQVNPDSDLAVPALTNLSLVHQAAGRSMEEALLVLRIHRLKPGHLRHERLLRAAGVLQEMAEEPGAIELLQWLSAHNGGEQVWRPLAALLERRGDYQAAAQVYRLLLQPQQAAAPQQSP